MPLESLERLAASYTPDTSATRKRVLVVVNPYATTVSDRLRNLVVYALQSRYDVEAIDTQARDHATALAREAAHEGYDAVVSFGGDGTVNEVANGLAGSDTPLTCLPGGATNVLCKMLGIPGEIVDATEHLLRLADRWEPRLVDLASVNGRHFTFTSGFGLDASVVKRVDERPTLKASLRQYYFAYAAVSTFLRHYMVKPPRMDVHVGDLTHRGVTAIVQNGDPMTYFNTRPVRAAEGITLDGGTLGGVVLRRASPLDVPSVAFRLLVERARIVDHRRVEGFSGVEVLRCVSVDGRKIPLQVDGDHIGDFTEAVYAIQPAGLGVIA
jgi:diacylglycerol kinase family enzyme